eukprot:m.122848 g.122848  ORF g.122848 m.122848 type:complete len:108 (+) comp37803_c0_seq3:65-388(+)
MPGRLLKLFLVLVALVCVSLFHLAFRFHAIKSFWKSSNATISDVVEHTEKPINAVNIDYARQTFTSYKTEQATNEDELLLVARSNVRSKLTTCSTCSFSARNEKKIA